MLIPILNPIFLLKKDLVRYIKLKKSNNEDNDNKINNIENMPEEVVEQ
jgi:hypothetical protein